ncbi:cation:proton antiporter [Sessilibacter sp. MAH4]
MSDPVILLVSVGLASIACQLLAHKLRIPAILPLLILGILVGPVFGLLDPDALFGDLLFPLISISVAIILFEGSLTLKLKEMAEHGSVVRNLCTVGTVITWLVATPAAHYGLGFSWQMSALFGAIVTVTGPTVIVPMLRSVRPAKKIADILRWEGIIIDPIGALLAVLVYEFIISVQDAWTHTLAVFGLTLAVGLGFGLLIGFSLGWLLKKRLIPHYLENTAVLTLMLGAFAFSNHIAHESGLLTVTIMGMVMANMKNIDLDPIIEFKETLSVLLISGLFILLAARLNIDAITNLGLGSILVLLAIMFIARPIAVFVSSLGSELTLKDKALLSWIAPRGIVAAAVSSLFAIKLESNGFDEASALVPMVFLVIIVTVVLQSLSSVKVAKLLKLRSPSATGILIFGANEFNRRFAKALKEHGISVTLADTNWDSVSKARMDNLNAYFGNPSSAHAENVLDFSTIGRVLVMSPYRQLNPVVTYHFEYLLGKGHVIGLSHAEQDQRASHKIAQAYAERLCLFEKSATYGRLASMTARGAVIKTTRLGDNFDLNSYESLYKGRSFPLCAFDSHGKMHLYTTQPNFQPSSGWLIVSLVEPESEVSKQLPVTDDLKSTVSLPKDA